MRKQTRVIKLDLEVYNRLDELREKRESFSRVVDRLAQYYIMSRLAFRATGPVARGEEGKA